MAKEKQYVDLKLNADLRGHKKGEVIKLEARGRMPIDVYWKRRIRDARIDNCVELVEKKSTSSSSKKSYNSEKGDK
jgi:hypothetical protein